MKKRGARLLVDALVKEGVEVVFGIPGVQNMHVYDALEDVKDITSVVTRHEQGAGYMADGYARVSGKPGVVITVPGPGALNVITPLGEAYSDSSPMLFITVEVASSEINYKRGYLHEMDDQMGTFKSVVKKAYRVNSAAEIPAIISRAYREAGEDRPRPVYVEIPIDFLKAEIHHTGEEENLTQSCDQIRRKGVAKAVELIKNSRRPLIYAGVGAVHAEAGEHLIELAEKMCAPIMTTVKGKGVVPYDHPLSIGTSWCSLVKNSDIVKEADVIVCVGTSLSARTWRHGKLQFNGSIIHIDVDPRSIGRNYPVEVGIVGDAAEAVSLILDELGNWSRKDENILQQVKTLREQVKQDLSKQPELYSIFSALEDDLKKGGIVVSDLTMAGIWAGRYLPVYKPRTFLFPMEFGTLGFSLPAAIGAKLACPDKNVICISGDGGFLFNSQELSTAVKLGIDLVVLLFNDGRYGSVRVNQIKTFGRPAGSDLYNPDFVKLAEAYGTKGVRIAEISEFEKVYRDALNNTGVSLIEIPADFMESY